MDGENTPEVRPFVGIVDRYRSIAAQLDTAYLKRIAVATYFGVYAIIALGGRRVLNEAIASLPAVVRPPRLAPFHIIFDLPRSVAWALVSFSMTLFVLGGLITISLYHDHRESSDRPPRLGERSLVSRIVPTSSGCSVERRVRSITQWFQEAISGHSTLVSGDRPSPSTDGGSTVENDTPSGTKSTVDGDDVPSNRDRDSLTERDDENQPVVNTPTEDERGVDPLNSFDSDVSLQHGDESNDSEVPTSRKGVSSKPNAVIESEATGDDDQSPQDTFMSIPSSILDPSGESASRLEEPEAGGGNQGTEDDGNKTSSESEWPGDWIAGDDL